MKKVEQRQQAKEAENEAASSQTDVATILARRVAVEMSDSEGGGPSDSEYDSDDWGDESTAWHRLGFSSKQQKQLRSHSVTGIISTTPTGSECGSLSAISGVRGLSNQYFFKSQESLATVIDTVFDNDENEGECNEQNNDVNISDDVDGECGTPKIEEQEEAIGKTTTVWASVYKYSSKYR